MNFIAKRYTIFGYDKKKLTGAWIVFSECSFEIYDYPKHEAEKENNRRRDKARKLPFLQLYFTHTNPYNVIHT